MESFSKKPEFVEKSHMEILELTNMRTGIKS